VTARLGACILAGAASGGLALAITLLVRAALPARRAPWPLGGPALLVAIGLGFGFGVTQGLPGLVLAALVLAAVAGAAAEAFRWRPALAAPLAVPAAALVVAAAPEGTRVWAAALAGTGVVVVGGLLADVDHRWREQGLAPPLLAVTTAGVLLVVPDTDHAGALAGATAALALMGWPVPLASLGMPGAFVASSAVAWVALQGGVGRPASIVGALACWGLVLVEPLVARGTRHGRAGVLRAGAVHAAVVVAASRVAGRGTSPVVAAVLAVAFLAAGAVAWRRLAVARSG
jgi:hypothetical protein